MPKPRLQVFAELKLLAKILVWNYRSLSKTWVSSSYLLLFLIVWLGNIGSITKIVVPPNVGKGAISVAFVRLSVRHVHSE